jgi:hypothetical protein
VADNKKTPGEEIGAALFKLAKPVYKEAKRMERERNRYTRPSSYYERPPRWSQKEIVFSVLPQAMRTRTPRFRPGTSITPLGRSTSTTSATSGRNSSTPTFLRHS